MQNLIILVEEMTIDTFKKKLTLFILDNPNFFNLDFKH